MRSFAAVRLAAPRKPRAAGPAISPPMSDIIVTAAVAIAATALIIAFAALIIDVVAGVRETAERRAPAAAGAAAVLYGSDPDWNEHAAGWTTSLGRQGVQASGPGSSFVPSRPPYLAFNL